MIVETNEERENFRIMSRILTKLQNILEELGYDVLQMDEDELFKTLDDLEEELHNLKLLENKENT